MPRKAIARIPASTTNLGPGFDVLGLALQLYSSVELEEIDNGIEILVRGIDSEIITNSTDNIAYRAANLVFERSGYKPKGLRLSLVNGIPAIRGLGGSGTAVLGGLLTANALCDKPFSSTELLNFATALDGHPDNVAASLLGGFVVSLPHDGCVHFGGTQDESVVVERPCAGEDTPGDVFNLVLGGLGADDGSSRRRATSFGENLPR